MAKEEWGTKRVCPTTGKRFYDLGRIPVISPYTGDVVEVTAARAPTMSADSEDSVTARLKAKATDGDEEALIDDDDADIDIDDELLDEADSDNVSFDELGEVASNDEDES